MAATIQVATQEAALTTLTEARVMVVVVATTMGTEEDTATNITTIMTEATRETMEDIVVEVAMMIGA